MPDMEHTGQEVTAVALEFYGRPTSCAHDVAATSNYGLLREVLQACGTHNVRWDVPSRLNLTGIFDL